MKRTRKPQWRVDAERKGELLAALQFVLNLTPEAWGRKQVICACREADAISDEDTALLLQAYQLETA